MTLNSRRVASIIVAAMAGGILLSMALNTWKTESTKVPAKFTLGEFAGEYNPGDIRGSYSFADISDAFDISVDDLAKAFGANGEENPAEVKAKDMEELYGALETGEIGTDSIRYFVALFTGRPYSPKADTLLPGPALSVLKDRVSEETLRDLRSITAGLSDLRAAAPAEDSDFEGDTTVRGRTTFQELYDWGLTKEEISEAIQLEVGKNGVTVRDHVAGAGYEFSTIKEKLQGLINTKAD